jgi:hypothetical protein
MEYLLELTSLNNGWSYALWAGRVTLIVAQVRLVAHSYQRRDVYFIGFLMATIAYLGWNIINFQGLFGPARASNSIPVWSLATALLLADGLVARLNYEQASLRLQMNVVKTAGDVHVQPGT